MMNHNPGSLTRGIDFTPLKSALSEGTRCIELKFWASNGDFGGCATAIIYNPVDDSMREVNFGDWQTLLGLHDIVRRIGRHFSGTGLPGDPEPTAVIRDAR